MKSNYDVIIVGAGPAGIGAGISAIKAGLDTLIVHADSDIGGQATNIYVGTICGAHTRFKAEDTLVGNFTTNFIRSLADRSKTKPFTNEIGLSYLPYKREEFINLSKQELKAKNLSVKNQSTVINLHKDQDKIISLEIQDQNDTHTFTSPVYIDCSGNGILSTISQAELIEEEEYQESSIVVGLSGIKEKDENVLRLSLYKKLEEAFRSEQIKTRGHSLTLVKGTSSTYPDTVYFKFNSHQKNLRYKEEVEQLNLTLEYLKSEHIFSAIKIDFLSKAKGIRSYSRPLGLSVLKDEAVLNANKSKDSIARGLWPVELWKGSNAPLIEHLKDDSYYDIPYTCLLSKSFSNLLSAGRALSSEEKAHSSARVIGTALQTGFASGFLANSIINQENLEDSVKTYQLKEYGNDYES